MPGLILFDPPYRKQLWPLAATRPVADFRIGILTIREKWERSLLIESSSLTDAYLQPKFPVTPSEDAWLINGSVCPTPALVAAIQQLQPGERLLYDHTVLAIRYSVSANTTLADIESLSGPAIVFQDKCLVIDRLWKLFSHNGSEIQHDIDRLVKGSPNPEELDDNNTLIGGDIYVAKGASVQGAILNSQTGPIYIGPHAEIMEGSIIRGPFAMGDHSVVKMGAKIYGPTTLGPHCKVGGEINNAILFGYSNKAHDGFLGNSVLGEWCNLGADTNNSNLKNNYAEVKLWDYATSRFENTGMQFCGLIMGDHSKCGINTMFNTGTVVGVSANIFGAGFPRNFIPDFSWGGAAKTILYQPEKAFEVAERVMSRRQVTLSEADKAILRHIFEETHPYRQF